MSNDTNKAANPVDTELLNALRHHRRKHRRERPVSHISAKVTAPPTLTFGQRLADRVASVVGSWSFILTQSAVIAAWIFVNSLIGKSWDPYPFILLNLMLSFQAAYTAPAIMMSQNRKEELDRQRAENDYEVNVKAELEIELLHQKIDLLKEKEILALTEAVRSLSGKLDALLSNNAPPARP